MNGTLIAQKPEAVVPLAEVKDQETTNSSRLHQVEVHQLMAPVRGQLVQEDINHLPEQHVLQATMPRQWFLVSSKEHSHLQTSPKEKCRAMFSWMGDQTPHI